MGRTKLFSRAIKVGRVTEKYPFAPVEVPEDFRGKPEIDPEKCIGCGACANACPPEALKVEEDSEKGIRTVRFFLGRCIFCARCEEVCPVGAIKLTREFELASLSRDDLYQEVKLKMVKCPVCGKYFDTVRHLKHVAKDLPEEQRFFLILCPECRAKICSEIIVFKKGGVSGV